MDTPKPVNKAIIASIIVVLLVVAATAVVAVNSNQTATTTADDTTASSVTTTSSSTSASASSASTSASYKDGTYTATGTYSTPGGRESIGVTLTVSSDTITDASVTQNASGGEAAEYQEAFVSGYKTEVVGKKLSEVSLSRVSGSSLTPQGFNSAVATIRTEAAA